MGTFFNDLKRAFTAPKTRHMQKKIDSMKYYMGFAKQLFEQMKNDADFFRKCEEKFDIAIRGMTGGINYVLANQKLRSISEQTTIFADLYDHKIHWSNIGDNELSTFEAETNNKLGELKQTNEGQVKELLINLRRNVQGLQECDDYRPNRIDLNQLRQYKALLQTHKIFCRETKQKIKTLFEKKKAEFETQRKYEKDSLKKLHNKTKSLQTFLNKENFADAIKIWHEISLKHAESAASQENPLITKHYIITRASIIDRVKNEIRKLCNDITNTLTSYDKCNDYKTDTRLTTTHQVQLTNSYDKLENLIQQLTIGAKDYLPEIGTCADNLNHILKDIQTATSKFLDDNNTTPISKIHLPESSIDKILDDWE